ncbi:MAG TPA: hypothetical protein VGH38_35545 [Bryobacteraceae bacterium]
MNVHETLTTNDNLIGALSERGRTDQEIGMVLGGCHLRIWPQTLPQA